MDVRHLRYFLAVAEELHFGRAAKALHMSQPPLSRRIADLEAELGVRLFERTSQRVTLSPDGERLQPLAREAVRAFDAAVEAFHPDRFSKTCRINVALPAETATAVVTEVAAALSDVGIQLVPHEASTGDQLKMLGDGTIDLGVIRLPCADDRLWLSPPMTKDLGVVMSRHHPLADAADIELAELSGYPLVIFPRELSPGLYDATLEGCEAGGFTPSSIDHAVRSLDSHLRLGSAVTLLPSDYQLIPTDTCVWRPIRGNRLAWRTAIACRERDRKSDVLAAAANGLVESLSRHDQWSFEGPRVTATSA